MKPHTLFLFFIIFSIGLCSCSFSRPVTVSRHCHDLQIAQVSPAKKIFVGEPVAKITMFLDTSVKKQGSFSPILSGQGMHFHRSALKTSKAIAYIKAISKEKENVGLPARQQAAESNFKLELTPAIMLFVITLAAMIAFIYLSVIAPVFVTSPQMIAFGILSVLAFIFAFGLLCKALYEKAVENGNRSAAKAAVSLMLASFVFSPLLIVGFFMLIVAATKKKNPNKMAPQHK